jgi:uncharacterized protein YqgC (DUF456 family)
MATLLLIGAILLILGIAGSIIPALPGPVLSFAGIIFLILAKGSGAVPIWHIILFGIFVFLLTLANYLSPILGAKFAGSTKIGTWGAIIGAIFGLILFPPLGIFFGALIGAVAGESYSGKNLRESSRAGVGVLLGGAAAIILQLAYSLTAAIYFLAKIIA